MATEENAEPAGAGWYPDPEQVETVRYWDGAAWTDQRAPASTVQAPAASGSITLRSGLGILGGVMALVAVFLPQLDSETSLHIAHNSIIGNEVAAGVIGILIALAAIQSSYRLRNEESRYWPLVFLGVVLIAVAIYAGTGERLELQGTGFLEGHEIQATPGIGIYVLGVGGALIALAGLSRNPQ